METAAKIAGAGLMAVELAALDIGSDAQIALVAAWAVLSYEECARAERLRARRDRDRFVRCRGLVRHLLGHRLGIAPSRVAITTGVNGKPLLPDAPLAFNVSHTGGIGVVALSWDGPVGIDLERVERSVDVLGVAHSVFTPGECALLATLSEPQRRARFFAFWTAKEARMKLTGEGMSLAPRAIALRLADGLPIAIDAPCEPPAALCYPALPFEGVVCCLATPRSADVGGGPR